MYFNKMTNNFLLLFEIFYYIYINIYFNIQCGSFTALNGGQNFPYVIRRTKPKDIKVVLTSGSNDMDNQYGNWAIANHAMADAFRFAGYDYRYDFGVGGHNLLMGSSMFAEHLRWFFSSSSSKL